MKNTTTTTDTAPPVSEKEKAILELAIAKYGDNEGPSPMTHEYYEGLVSGFIDGYAASEGRSGWIPVEYGQAKPQHKTGVWITVEWAEGLRSVIEASYNEHRGKWFWPDSTEKEIIGKVLAWTPLNRPQPYTKEEPDAE